MPSPFSRPLLITPLNQFIAWRSSVLLSPLAAAPIELPLPIPSGFAYLAGSDFILRNHILADAVATLGTMNLGVGGE
jgi:hypothetical protein